MSATLDALADLAASAGRMLALGLDILADRLELLGIEAREAKVRLVQALLLAILGAALLVVGLGLAVLAVLLALPPGLRLAFAAGGGAACLLAGAAALWVLRRRLARLPLAFAQTLEELRKDRACF